MEFIDTAPGTITVAQAALDMLSGLSLTAVSTPVFCAMLGISGLIAGYLISLWAASTAVWIQVSGWSTSIDGPPEPTLAQIISRATRSDLKVEHALVAALAGVIGYGAGLLTLNAGHPSPTPAMAVSVALACWLLIASAALDARVSMMADAPIMALLFLGLASATLFPMPVTIEQSAIGAASCYALLEGLRRVGRWVTGKPAMGDGDPLLLAAIAAWTGSWLGLLILVGAAITCLAYMLADNLAQHRASKFEISRTVAFGPFLAALGGTAILGTNVIRVML